MDVVKRARRVNAPRRASIGCMIHFVDFKRSEL
jgi:hypothetical protein